MLDLLSRQNDTHWFLVGEMRVGEMRVGEMRVGEMRAGKMRVGLELEVTIDWFAETTVHTQHRLKETNIVRTSSIRDACYGCSYSSLHCVQAVAFILKSLEINTRQQHPVRTCIQ